MTRVAWRHRDDRVRHQAAEGLIDIHILNRVFAEVVAEHLLDNTGVRQALHDRALARGHLAGYRTIDGVFSVRDRGNMSNRLLRNRSHITGELTEWPFNVGFSGIYLPFDHDFCIGGNEGADTRCLFELLRRAP